MGADGRDGNSGLWGRETVWGRNGIEAGWRVRLVIGGAGELCSELEAPTRWALRLVTELLSQFDFSAFVKHFY